MPNIDPWDVHPDGDRFLVLTPAGPDATCQVLLNWRRLQEDASSGLFDAAMSRATRP